MIHHAAHNEKQGGEGRIVLILGSSRAASGHEVNFAAATYCVLRRTFFWQVLIRHNLLQVDMQLQKNEQSKLRSM